MLIERHNGGALRRYHVGPGAIAVVVKEPGKQRQCYAIPPALPHVAVPVSAEAVAARLRASRH